MLVDIVRCWDSETASMVCRAVRHGIIEHSLSYYAHAVKSVPDAASQKKDTKPEKKTEEKTKPKLKDIADKETKGKKAAEEKKEGKEERKDAKEAKDEKKDSKEAKKEDSIDEKISKKDIKAPAQDNTYSPLKNFAGINPYAMMLEMKGDYMYSGFEKQKQDAEGYLMRGEVGGDLTYKDLVEIGTDEKFKGQGISYGSGKHINVEKKQRYDFHITLGQNRVMSFIRYAYLLS